jgi:membrane fusion protein (multidrug efflux system)
MSEHRPPAFARVFAFLIIAGLVAAVAMVLHQQETAAPAAKAAALKAASVVTTTTVKRENYVTDIAAIGTAEADESIAIMPNVTETVTSLAFDDEQFVKKGSLLAVLSDAEEQAMLASARSSLAEEERETARLVGLVKEGAAPEAKLEEGRTKIEVARQKIQEAEAKIADRHIVAPFDGWIGLRRISVGALVSPSTVIATLDKLDVIKVTFSVPETVITSLKPGTEITSFAEAARDKKFKGKIAHIDSRIDPITRSIEARAEVANPDRDLKPGMLVMVQLAMLPSMSLSIPERSLVPVGTKAYVFTIESDKAKRTEVKIGRRKPGYIEILSGLKEGQSIIVDGLVGLQEGTTVRVAGEFTKPVPAFNPEQGK